MTREQHEALKKQLAEIHKKLEEENLTPETRQDLEKQSALIAGLLMRSWLPFDWARRSIMIALFLVGLYGLRQHNDYFLVAWLFIWIFSPRATAEVTFALGRLGKIIAAGSSKRP